MLMDIDSQGRCLKPVVMRKRRIQPQLSSFPRKRESIFNFVIPYSIRNPVACGICRFRATSDPISFAQPKEIGERKGYPAVASSFGLSAASGWRLRNSLRSNSPRRLPSAAQAEGAARGWLEIEALDGVLMSLIYK